MYIWQSIYLQCTNSLQTGFQATRCCFFLTKLLNKLCKCIFLLHSKCFVNLDKCSYFENRQLFFAIATLCLLPWKLFVELCTWIHKLHRYSALVHRPPVDLHLIFEKSSLQNQVGRTWFFVYFELDFCRLHRQ